jgi:hypothetical protein
MAWSEISVKLVRTGSYYLNHMVVTVSERDITFYQGFQLFPVVQYLGLCTCFGNKNMEIIFFLFLKSKKSKALPVTGLGGL